MNTASRMESHGLPSKIHLGQPTANLILDEPKFSLKLRGTINIKVVTACNPPYLSSIFT